MKTNPNEIETYEATPEQLDALLARSVEQALAERDAKLRAAAWPGNVDDLLATVVRELAAVRQRVTVLEGRFGIAEA